MHVLSYTTCTRDLDFPLLKDSLVKDDMGVAHKGMANDSVRDP